MQLKNCKALLFCLLTIFSLSCSRQEILNKDKTISSSLTFYSFIEGENFSKAAGTEWDINDSIGIYMLYAGEELSESSALALNRHYTTPGTGVFTPYSDKEMIYLPEDETAVNFIAYYPYTSAIQNFIYPVNVSNQESQESIDLLYAYNKKEHTTEDKQSSFSFTHQLVKLVLNISPATPEQTLDGVTVTIDGMKTEASFNLATGVLIINDNSGKKIELKTTSYATGKVRAEAVLLPMENLSDVKIVFTLPSGETSTWKLKEDEKYEAGNRYTYDVTLKGGEIVEPVSYGYFESPAVSAIENTIFVRHFLPEADKQHIRNFSLLYDTVYKLAYWVAYPLHSDYIGSSGRTDKWAYDPKIDTRYQPKLASGWGVQNVDRGHQLPSADRTYSKEGNQTTFYYSNMTAQNSTLNQQVWARLEAQVRNWSSNCDTLYVVTGAMIQTTGDETIEFINDNEGKKIARPKYYYKALASKQGNSYYTIAYKMDNIAIPSSTDFNLYKMSVSELEEWTGFTFFPELDQGVKSIIDNSIWN